jgi:hypothetical protein
MVAREERSRTAPTSNDYVGDEIERSDLGICASFGWRRLDYTPPQTLRGLPRTSS